MQSRELSINKITNHLGVIKNQIGLRNSIHLYDINIHSEEFFKDLLNKVYGYQLENLNYSYILSESVDLGDSQNGIAFQVTSNKSRKKIAETVRSFYDNGTSRDYPVLKILLLGDKPKRHDSYLQHNEFKFDLRSDIIDFSDLLKSIGKLETPRISEIEHWIDSEMQNNKFGSYTPPTAPDFDKYFTKFLNNDIDSDALLFKAQPSLADCREVFSDEYFLMVHHIYSMFYFSMLASDKKTNDKLRDKEIYRCKTSNLREIESKNHNLPGGMSEIVAALRPGKLQYHSVSFTKREEERGITFNIWIFLNGRWVFFPKPWQLILGIKELKDHRGLKTMVRILKFFGIKINGPKDHAGAFATLILFNELAKK
jgi:hypothetical protein